MTFPRGDRFRALAGQRRIAAQASFYALSLGGSGLLAIIAQGLLTRAISVANYGVYGFAASFLLFVSLFFEFGLFTPAARLAARAQGTERRQIVGAALVLFVPIGVAFTTVVFGASFVVNDFVSFNAATPLRDAAIFSASFPFALIGLQLAQGTHRLHLFSITRVIGQGSLVFVLGILVASGTSITAGSALAIRGATMSLGWALLCWWLRPLFGRARDHVRWLVKDARTYGAQIYVGRITSIGTYNMDVLMLGIYSDAPTVGFYSLAGALCSAVSVPAVAFATAAFPRMATTRRIPGRWLQIAWAVSLLAAASLFAVGGWLVPVLFGSDFKGAVTYIGPLAAAAALRGVTQVYNQYLMAQAQGKALRDAGLVLTATNLIANFALIPPFGGLGAAWASVIALVANLGAHIVGYRRSLRRLPEAAA